MSPAHHRHSGHVGHVFVSTWGHPRLRRSSSSLVFVVQVQVVYAALVGLSVMFLVSSVFLHLMGGPRAFIWRLHHMLRDFKNVKLKKINLRNWDYLFLYCPQHIFRYKLDLSLENKLTWVYDHVIACFCFDAVIMSCGQERKIALWPILRSKMWIKWFTETQLFKAAVSII